MRMLRGKTASWSGGSGGYTQNFVDNAGTAYLSTAALSSPDRFEASFYLTPQTLNTGAFSGHLWMTGGRMAMGITDSGKFEIYFENQSGAVGYSGKTTNVELSASTTYHIYIGVDMNVPSVELRIDGVEPAMTVATSINGTGTNWNQPLYILSDSGATLTQDDHISDLVIIDPGASMLGYDEFYNGGTPVDPTTHGGTKLVVLGGAQTADELDGNTAQGWNDSYNQGTLSITTQSATFVDV